MSDREYMSREELDAKIKSSDRSEALEYSNKLLRGEVVVGQKPEEPQTDDTTETAPMAVAQDSRGGILPQGDGQSGNNETNTVDNGSGQEAGKGEEEKPTEQPTDEELSEKERKLKEQLEENEQIVEAIRRKRQEEKDAYFQKQQEAEKKLNELEQNVGSYKDAVERLQKELDEKSKKQPEKQNNIPEIDEDEDVIDAAPRYSKNNRKLIDSLKEQINSIPKVPDNSEQINKLVERLEKYEQSQAEAEAERARQIEEEQRKRTKQILFDNIRSFQSRNESFQTKTDPEKLAETYRVLRSEVAELIGSGEPRDINRAIDSLVRGSSESDEEFRKRALKEGIKIPEEMDKFLMISEINDIKNGVRYDKITGKLEPVKDEFGRQVVKESLDEAYRSSNYYDKINEVRREAAMNYQNKMNVREESAVVLDNKQTTTEGEHSAMSKERIHELVTMPYHLYKNNPELAKQVAEAYRAAGVSPPVVGKHN